MPTHGLDRATFGCNLRSEPNHFEPWQVTRYKRGESYDYHVDAGCWRNHPSGERKRTILIYLERPARGEATDFRALHKRVRPIAGRLLSWDNLFSNGKCNYVTNEEKVINEIIGRYGSVIDLKKNPHVISEIIRQCASRLGVLKAECLPPGGPPSKAAAAE